MRKTLILLIASLAMISCSLHYQDLLKSYQNEGYDVLEHAFGQYQVKLSENETHIFDVGININNSPSLRETFEEKMKNFKKEDLDDAVIHCSKGKNPQYYNFLAQPLGVVGNNKYMEEELILLQTNEDTCFSIIELTYIKTSDNSFRLEFEGKGQRQGGLTCNNLIQIASAETMHTPILMTFANAKHTVIVENQTAAQMESVKKWGLHIYQTCDKIANLIPDLKMTLSLYIGGLSDDPNGEGIFNSRPTEAQSKANIDALKGLTDYEWKELSPPVDIDLDETQIKSGDFLIIDRLDGLDQLIQFGAGGHVGHTCIVLEVDGEMMVTESQDGWYWPKHGIQRNTWKQWKEWAKNAGFNVAILRLSDEKQKIMDQNLDKAVEFFKKMEGLPYGYHNFLFGWFDDVPKNIPPITDFTYLFIILSQLENIIPTQINSMLGEPLNLRLGTKGLNLAQIANECVDRGITLEYLFSIPEQDDWVYSDGASMVCSAFVAGVYKAAGLFGDAEIQATEFTPRDVYQLDFYQPTNAGLADECIQSQPDLPYCQIMGDFSINITTDKFNQIHPYSNMFERCPSQTPLFERNTEGPNRC